MENKKKYLANLHIGNVLLHNLHWNIKGLAFKQIHEYLESLYNDAFEKFDEVAERMKMDGQMPPASVKEYLELKSIDEIEVKEYSIEESLEIVKKYLSEMKKEALEIRNSSSDEEFAWANMMEDHIEGYEKQIWFLNQSL